MTEQSRWSDEPALLLDSADEEIPANTPIGALILIKA